MYKVLLVDDEPWALSGIRDTFQWEKYGFYVMSETTVASEALDIILSSSPDVVFTDIRMPGISGIELMQKVREQGMDTEFVIISGFGEFSYAQQAMRQGALDYCLKPLEFEYADKLLQKISRHLEIKTYNKKSALFEAMIENKGEQAETLRKLGLLTNFRYYQAMVLVYEKEEAGALPAMEFPASVNKIEVRLGHNKLFYLMNLEADIKKLVDLSAVSGACIGISSLAASSSDMELLYYEADAAAGSYFIYNEYKVFRYKKRSPEQVNRLLEKLCPAVENNMQQELSKLLDEVPIFFRVNGLGLEDVVYLWNQLVAFVSKRCDTQQLSMEFDFTDYTQVLLQFGNIKALCEYLKNDVLGTPENSDTAGYGEKAGRDFTGIISYINQHYSEQLYLRDIAARFYMNPNYCCKLFKKYTGGTFSEYLNNLRMDMAVSLLKGSELTIEEIAEKAGYNDYFYFIKLFKKYKGVPPARFRKEHLGAKT